MSLFVRKVVEYLKGPPEADFEAVEADLARIRDEALAAQKIRKERDPEYSTPPHVILNAKADSETRARVRKLAGLADSTLRRAGHD